MNHIYHKSSCLLHCLSFHDLLLWGSHWSCLQIDHFQVLLQLNFHESWYFHVCSLYALPEQILQTCNFFDLSMSCLFQKKILVYIAHKIYHPRSWILTLFQLSLPVKPPQWTFSPSYLLASFSVPFKEFILGFRLLFHFFMFVCLTSSTNLSIAVFSCFRSLLMHLFCLLHSSWFLIFSSISCNVCQNIKYFMNKIQIRRVYTRVIQTQYMMCWIQW